MKACHAIAIASLLLTSCGSTKSDPEQQFEKMMTGATMVGYSTGSTPQGLSNEERYNIQKVTKLGGETWLFQTRMHFGSHDLPLPVPVTIKWAGDTPVITLTDVSLPGLGTFTARVLLYRDQYAGTWSGHGAGGQLFGKIIHEH